MQAESCRTISFELSMQFRKILLKEEEYEKMRSTSMSELMGLTKMKLFRGTHSILCTLHNSGHDVQAFEIAVEPVGHNS